MYVALPARFIREPAAEITVIGGGSLWFGGFLTVGEHLRFHSGAEAVHLKGYGGLRVVQRQRTGTRIIARRAVAQNIPIVLGYDRGRTDSDLIILLGRA